MAGRPHTIAIVLAGGEGKRLDPLTRTRAKPAVPFGGHYRIIDFVLSNLTNARFLRVMVLTQYKSHSLNRHLAQSWRLSPTLGEYVVPVPAQMRRGPHWFAGSADAIYQNFNILDDESPDYVLVFGADHVYRMDPAQMLDAHIRSGAGLTVCGLRVPLEQAKDFGVLEADASGRILAFQEKPLAPRALADDPSRAYGSTGNYVFSTSLLREAITVDAKDEESAHDVGGDLIPMLVERGEAQVYDFSQNVVPGQMPHERSYWRDVGTLDAFHSAHMDLVSENPSFDLYNPEWPINSWKPTRPPAKYMLAASRIEDSIICDGAIISGGSVVRSVLAPSVRIESGAHVEESVLMDGVRVGADAVVRRAILDKHVTVAAGTLIGVEPARSYVNLSVTPSGLAVAGKGEPVG